MSWADEAATRKRHWQRLVQARRCAVEAGSRRAVATLTREVNTARVRFHYAEKMARIEGKSAAAWPGFLHLDSAQFATRDNRPDNGAKGGGDAC